MSEIADHHLGPPCCHLIQIGDATVLTDPWFSGRVLCHPGEPVAADAGDLPCFGRKAIPLLAAGPAASRARGAGCTGAQVLEPGQAAVPHHYVFSSGWLGDRLLTNSDSGPGQFGPVARRLTSRSAVHVVQPGQLLMLRTAAEDPFAGGRPGYGETVHDGV